MMLEITFSEWLLDVPLVIALACWNISSCCSVFKDRNDDTK